MRPSDYQTNIIIPLAGFGKRLRPQTWSKPKPLVSAAGKPVLGHVLDTLATVPNFDQSELVFVTGWLGEQVEAYLGESYPNLKASFVEQKELLGQSHAIAQAEQFLQGPTLIVFVDTMIESDFSFLADETADAVIWVKEVDDPRRFGVVDLDAQGWVDGLIEKPDDPANNLAIVGLYYFARGEDLMAAIQEQMQRGILTKGEYFLADAMDIMLKRGLKMRPQKVDVWLDAGVPATVLETNRYLLDHGRDNTAEVKLGESVQIMPPVFVHPSARLSGSAIGPHASIGPDCVIENSHVQNSVLEAGVHLKDCDLTGSLAGLRVHLEGVKGIINLGDDAVVKHA